MKKSKSEWAWNLLLWGSIVAAIFSIMGPAGFALVKSYASAKDWIEFKAAHDCHQVETNVGFWGKDKWVCDDQSIYWRR